MSDRQGGSDDPRGGGPVEPDAPPSEREIAEAEELRRALEDPTRTHEDAELARALAAAWSPHDLSAQAHGALVEQALVRLDGARRSWLRSLAGGRTAGGARQTTLRRVSFAASAVVALAAGVLLVFGAARRSPERGRPIANAASLGGLAVSRSTQPLFADRFAAKGGETSRIDRIAMARAADLRDNDFAKWGVR
jgi:hypothetical protein